MIEKHITLYVADDGEEFRSAKDCCDYEDEKMAVKAIMNRLPPWPPYEKYVVCDAELLRQIRRDLWPLVLKKYGDRYPKWRQWDADEVHPQSIVGRVLSDGATGPLEYAWRDLSCFDFDLGRIYDQPYYAINPKEASPMKEPPK